MTRRLKSEITWLRKDIIEMQNSASAISAEVGTSKERLQKAQQEQSKAELLVQRLERHLRTTRENRRE